MNIMKLTIALISMLAALASADILEKDAPCGDNKDCEEKCVDGRYRIVADNANANSVRFGCLLQPPPTYSNPDCSFGSVDGPDQTYKAKLTCDTVKGKLCHKALPLNLLGRKFINYCIILSDNSLDFLTNCSKNLGTITYHKDDVLLESVESDC
jgi:hypothetical protein